METFVVRIYPGDGPTTRPGRIEHVTSGFVLYFHALDELPQAVETALEAVPDELRASASRDR